MATQEYLGFVFVFDPAHGGRAVELVSGSADTVEEATAWVKETANNAFGESAWEVWRAGGGKEYLCLSGSLTPKARHYHLSSRVAVERRNAHLKLHKDGRDAANKVANPDPPEVSEAWLNDRVEKEVAAAIVPEVPGESMAYMVLVFGYPPTGSTEPTFLRALPYVDIGGLVGTIQHWQATCGGTWVRETWALWGDNERLLESSSSDPHWPAVHAASKLADEFREMVRFSTRLCAGMIPPPRLHQLSEFAHGRADEIMTEFQAREGALDRMEKAFRRDLAADVAKQSDKWEKAGEQFVKGVKAVEPCKPDGCCHKPPHGGYPDLTGNKLHDEMMSNDDDKANPNPPTGGTDETRTGGTEQGG